MNRRTPIICAFVAFSLLLVLCSSTNSQQRTTNNEARFIGALEIYLPREITITDNLMRLGQVAIIRGDESLVAKASNILLGRISVPGQKVIVERATILSRLACNDIPAQKVTFNGAQATAVKQQEQIIKGERFVELAKSFLENNPPTRSIALWEPVRIPADLILAGPNNDVKFSPQLIETGQTSQPKVRVTVLANGKELAEREVALRAKYNCRCAVTLTQIAAGAVITPENVKIQQGIGDNPEPANWRPPYGLVARRRLPANTVIGPDMLDEAKTAVRIGRNETVVIRVEMPGLVVTAIGKAMQDGHVGEHIKVRNSDSQRIILCKVNQDGTVEPVL